MGARKVGASDFHSERDQVAALEQAVGRLGGRLEVLPSELDVSGGLPLERRPSLQAAVQGVEAGRYRGIIVAYQSRLGRDVEQEEAVWRRVEAAGGRVELALDGLDTTTVDGRMVRRIRASINAAERERHKERFDDLRRWATAAGIWQRRQTPRGYRRDAETRRLVPDDDADLVAGVFRDRAAGATVIELARRLGMTTSGTRALLRNRVYLGELRVGEHVNPAAHPAIVDVDEFNAAQRSIARPARSPGAAPALLAGLVRCQACGHVMSRARTAAEVYAHPVSSSARDCPAPAAITVRSLDEHVERIARHELELVHVDVEEAAGALEAARVKIADAERELTAYLGAVSAADVGAEAFGAGARIRSTAIDAAREELDVAIALRPGRPPAGGSAGDLWDELDDHERNALLRGLVEVVIVRRAGKGRRVPVGDRVRVVGRGAGVIFRKTSSTPVGVRPLPWPDADGEHVLRVPPLEDRP